MAEFPVVFHFRVELQFPGEAEDVDLRFQEVTGLNAELGTEEVAEGGENRFSHRLPNRTKFGNLSLKRGMAKSSKLISWVENAIYNFEFEPVDAIVSILNEKHEPVFTWSFKKVWPVKWQVSDLKAQDNSIAIETFELSYDHFTRSVS